MGSSHLGSRFRRLLAICAIAPLAYTFVGCKVIQKKLEELASGCEPEGAAKCSKDGTQFLKCKSAHLEPDMECRGDKHCYQEGDKVHCDQSRGQTGDKCSSDGAACSSDGKARLQCKDGAMILEATCRGPKACHLDDGKAYCDNADFTVGVPCKDEGAACGNEGRSILNCKNGALVVEKDCHGPKGCSYTDDNRVLCDTSQEQK